MGIRTAIEHNPIVAFAVLFGAIWTFLIGIYVTTVMGGAATGTWVGRHTLGGLIGLGVLLGFLALLLTAFGELGEPNPAPNEWPPE